VRGVQLFYEKEAAMAVAEAGIAYNADRLHERAVLIGLRELANRNLQGASSQVTRIVGQIKAFLEWVDNPKPKFADDLVGQDKFAELVELSRQYQDCNSFYASDVGVNPSTVWRWANGKSRPSKYVGQKLAHEIEPRLAMVLWQLAEEEGLRT
jgi:hypothetical protein